MVHALTQAHRVLRPRGYLVDYRPDRDPTGRRRKRLEVSVTVGRNEVPAGVLEETASYYPDYVASDRAVRRVLAKRFFVLRMSEMVWPKIYFRTLAVLENYLSTQWTGTTLGTTTRTRLDRLLRARPKGQIAVVENFRLNVLQKL